MGWANDAPRCIDYQAVGGVMETPDGSIFSSISMMFQSADGQGDVMLTFVREDNHLRNFAKARSRTGRSGDSTAQGSPTPDGSGGPILDLEAAMSRMDKANAGLSEVFRKPQ